jgi:signal transduction histidine kinase
VSGEEARVLAEEQAALRRVATLVARGVPPEEVFAAVTGEVGRVLSASYAYLGRYEPDGVLTPVVSWGAATASLPAGSRWSLGGKNVATLVSETRRPARVDGFADASGPLGAAARERGVGSAAGTPVIVEGRLWGVVIVGLLSGERLLPAGAEARLASFTELVAAAIANAASRAALARLAQEQAALRRVATLVARGATPEEVFAAVAEEVGHLLPVESASMCRYDSDSTLTFVAQRGSAKIPFPVSSRWPLGGHNLGTLVFETGRPARVDRYADSSSGPLGAGVREGGLRSAVATPIIVEGCLWGVIAAGSILERPLPADAEARLASFTELVATAIANAESRAAAARLAQEQAALRRVATLVAYGAPSAEVFAAVTGEAGRLLGAHLAGMARYESDDTVTVLTAWAAEGEHPLVPGPWPLDGGDVASMVSKTGRSVRIDDYHGVAGRIAAFVREELGIISSVATPIVVEGRLWGVLFLHSEQARRTFPRDTESRLTGFTELVAAMIANTESRAALAASRTRIVAATDEARRRIERDLHDGTQQQLVSLILELRAVQAAVPAQLGDLERELSRIADRLVGVFDEVREISHGIHPAILSRRGLPPALKALARRSAVPVELDLRAGRRLPEQVEVAAYYTVSEALANAAKHARASAVHVELDTPDAIVRLAIRDDGIGGADPARGSGLVGLSDRIEALGGTLEVTSPAGGGTTLLIEIPAESRSTPAAPEP